MSDAFRFFKAAEKGTVRTGIQLLRLATGQPLPASDLTCYRVTAKRLITSWFKIDFLAGCRLFLAEDAAAELLAAGMIEKTFDEALVKHQGGHETPETRPWAEANDRARKQSRGKPRRRREAEPRGTGAPARKAAPAA